MKEMWNDRQESTKTGGRTNVHDEERNGWSSVVIGEMFKALNKILV
jgi:hypothetical protein